MKKTQQLSITKLEKYMKQNAPKEDVVTIDLPGAEDAKLCIRRFIGLQEVADIVETVAKSCVAGGRFYSFGLEYALRYNIVAKYTNARLPEDNEKAYELLFTTGLYELVKENANLEQLVYIGDAVERQIKADLAAANAAAACYTMKAVQQFEEVSAKLEDFAKSMGDIDMKKMAQTIQRLGDVSEEKMIKTILAEQKEETAAVKPEDAAAEK